MSLPSLIVWRLLPLVVGGYVLLVALVFLAQRRLLYPAPPGPDRPLPAGSKLERIDGAAGRIGWAWSIPAAPGRPTVVHFHGNGEQIGDQLDLARLYQQAGLGFFAVEYPGYGPARDGRPSEAGLYAAAADALDWLATRGIGPADVILEGQSLGTGVAVEMATRGRGSRLVLLSPFTSIADAAAFHFPFLPTRWMLLDRYDSLAKVRTLELPALVIHGDRDAVVPVELGQRLAAALPHASLHVIHAAGHVDLFMHPEVEPLLLGFTAGR